MTTTLPRRIAVVTALTVTAASGAAFSGGVASAHRYADGPRAHTSLSIRTQHTAINPGGGDVISGDLQSTDRHMAGRRITLRAHPQGATGWTRLARHRTRAHGRVTFQVSPDVTTRYQLVFAGNKRQAPCHSGTVQVRVLDTTSLVISVAQRSIEPGDSDTVNGVLSFDGAPLVGDTVELLGAPLGQRLAYEASAITDANGDVSFPVTPATSAHYALVFKRTADNAGARSAQAVIRVRMPSSLSIRARSNKRHGQEIISGDLRGAGRGLAHRKVSLQSRPTGTDMWTTVSSRFTRRHGAIGFHVPAPTVSTDYQLVFAGGPVFDGCQSGVVTVTVA
jgi:hypothetical protein